MKKMELDMKGSTNGKCKLSPPPPPPPPPPLPSTWVTRKPVKICRSVTKEEIEKFWRRKKIEEEDHLLAAIKAAARIRARNLSEEEYRRFEESLEEDPKSNKENEDESSKIEENDHSKEIRVGIKDWWTKSKYAYLNQPAIQSMDPPKRNTSTYIPNLCLYKPPPPQPFSMGVF